MFTSIYRLLIAHNLNARCSTVSAANNTLGCVHRLHSRLQVRKRLGVLLCLLCLHLL
jgi:hypothetical protein